MNYLDKINLAAENREMLKYASATAEAIALTEAKEKVRTLFDDIAEIMDVVDNAIEKGFIRREECFYLDSNEPIFQYKPQKGNCQNYYPIRIDVNRVCEGLGDKLKVTSVRGMGVGVLKYVSENGEYVKVKGKLALCKSKEKSDNWECFYNEFGEFKKRVYEYIDKKIAPFLM